MYKSEQARQVIYHQDPTVNTDWLDAVTIDTDSKKTTKAENEQLTKGFVRGLIGVKLEKIKKNLAATIADNIKI